MLSVPLLSLPLNANTHRFTRFNIDNNRDILYALGEDRTLRAWGLDTGRIVFEHPLSSDTNHHDRYCAQGAFVKFLRSKEHRCYDTSLPEKVSMARESRFLFVVEDCHVYAYEV